MSFNIYMWVQYLNLKKFCVYTFGFEGYSTRVRTSHITTWDKLDTDL